jgi:hypothetical protein
MGSVGEDTVSLNEDILRKWNSHELSFAERDTLLQQIEARGLYPKIMEANDEWETEGGLYPDIEDPRFAEKLMRKQEFAENKQDSIATQMEKEVNPCDPDKEFELTPVQRFIGRFMSPQCPYLSALLYHGVGVGKTCAAITVAENYLRSYPRRSVIIVAPRNIQPGFRRTIFDDEALKISESGVNTANGCTGNSYLKRTSTEFERDKPTVVRRVNQSIQSRYTFLGYIQFHRMIEDILKNIPKTLDEAATRARSIRLLRREFSGRLVIIDEAHNLRDTPGPGDDDADNPGGDMELSETQAGKKLTPSLLKVLEAAEGMKLVLLTGTPMYNSYLEIIFLLKLLLTNDKRAVLSQRDIFLPDGRFKPALNGRKSGEELLGSAANAYVSFMRGENPLSFPVRLPPQGTPTLTGWPAKSPSGADIAPEGAKRMLRMPFVPVQFEGDSMEVYKQISRDAVEGGGLSVGSIDEMVQSGNWMFPGAAGPAIRDAGFDECFKDMASGGASQFTAQNGAPTWLLASALGTVSPKAKFALERARTAKGVLFIYSRFIKSGALPLALALEANGYTPWGDKRPLLTQGVQTGEGLQCALCAKRQRTHAGADHKFVPAKYILITGRANISQNNPLAIQASRAKTNVDGRDVKIIIGSQVASEGVDFRFVREIYIFDSWFHLNKMEQVLGRGIRTCSHVLLPEEQRNCTTYLLVNTFNEGEESETADLYMYRKAMIKAIEVGRVTRVLKRYALDCNLNRDAIIVTGLSTQSHTDSQGVQREEVNVNDTPYSNLCDWIETCEYTCAKPIDVGKRPVDLSTYDEYAVRWRETQLKSAIRQIFEVEKQPQFQLDDILDAMSGVPQRAISGLLSDIVGNRSFRVRVRGAEGYIVYRNNYFMFQPDYLADIRVPLALRVADVPVKRDAFDPAAITLQRKKAVAAPVEQKEDVEQKEEAEEVEQEAQTEKVEKPAPSEPVPGTIQEYWRSISNWAIAISRGQSVIDDIPATVTASISSRYVGDEQAREIAWLSMISWLYEHMQTSKEYTDANKSLYLKGLAETLLQFIWDESLRPNEQLQLIQSADPIALKVGKEQIVSKEGVSAFRFVDSITGVLKYICGTTACAEAVRKEFEADPLDELRTLTVNTDTTGPLYGFNVPKAKERRLIFKTSSPPVPGGKLEKGGECAIISTISFHITMLKRISDMLVEEGFPRFILTEEILDEKTRKRAEKKAAEAAAKAAGRTVVVQTRRAGRTFENAVRACALKNIILRWMDIMKSATQPRKRYFYRPVAAFKSGHKGAVQKI